MWPNSHVSMKMHPVFMMLDWASHQVTPVQPSTAVSSLFCISSWRPEVALPWLCSIRFVPQLNICRFGLLVNSQFRYFIVKGGIQNQAENLKGHKIKKFTRWFSFQIFLLSYAWYCALTRVSDYKHHPTDVLAGGLLGIYFHKKEGHKT